MSAIVEMSLFEAFRHVRDPRKARGVRHPIHALLTLAAAAFLSGARSVNAIADFGRDHTELAGALGFTRNTLPCQATFHYLFKALDIDVFEAVLRAWVLGLNKPDASRRTAHVDGKSLRGSKRCASDCVHLLSAYCGQTGTVLAQLEVGDKTNEPKAALNLLRLITMKGTLITGDAMFTQRELSEQIVNEGGDYFWTVKDNQKTLRTEIDAAFESEALPLEIQARKADLRTAEMVDKGHGRIDRRSIETRSRIPSLINFPGAKQIGRIRRERTIKGVVTIETICFVTSLPRLRANAAALLKIARNHWSIENGLHRVRDVSMGEDACTVTSGSAPQTLAALRNAVLALLRKSKVTNIARAFRRHAAHPLEALELLARTVADF